MGDASRLGWEPARGFELCLCPGWSSGRQEPVGGWDSRQFGPCCSQNMGCGLAWLVGMGLRSTDWGQLCAKKLGQVEKGNQMPWSPAAMANPAAMEPGRAEGQGCLGWGITSSPLRDEHGGHPVLCPLPVSWSCVTPKDRAPWATARKHQAVAPGHVVGTLSQGVSAPRAGPGAAPSSEVLH